jgi:hypothetical protein
LYASLYCQKLPEEDEKSFPNRLDKDAAEAGSVFSDDALISAFVDGLLPYAGNTVRGQVTPQMTFAEVKILAENIGATGRSLMTPGISLIRWSIPSTPTGRPKVTRAASAESSPLQSQESYINSCVGVPIVAAVAEDTPFSEGNIARVHRRHPSCSKMTPLIISSRLMTPIWLVTDI